MSLGTKLYTIIFGKLVGSDEFGNKYYSNTSDFESLNAKRWVIFKGQIEASKVPPHWHAWLHKTTSEPPIDYVHQYKWQKKHQPNLTGTPNAHFPLSRSSSKSEDSELKNNYEKWKP